MKTRYTSSVYLNVALKQANAGGGVLRTFRQQGANIQNLLNIIYETKAVAPHPVSAHPRVPKKVMDQVAKTFVTMKSDPKHQALLKQIPMQQPIVATVADYQPLKELGLDAFYVRD